MSKFHVNPDTGNASRCRAGGTASCPFGSIEHFDTLKEARGGFETLQESSFTELPKITSKTPTLKVYGDVLYSDFEPGEYYESASGEWEFLDSPELSSNEEINEIVSSYWKEKYIYWTTAWLNPDQARGLCTDSAEDFASYAKESAFTVEVLELHNGVEPHTVALLKKDSSDSGVIVDFTYRQFDSSSTVPHYSSKEDFIAEKGWKILEVETL